MLESNVARHNHNYDKEKDELPALGLSRTWTEIPTDSLNLRLFVLVLLLLPQGIAFAYIQRRQNPYKFRHNSRAYHFTGGEVQVSPTVIDARYVLISMSTSEIKRCFFDFQAHVHAPPSSNARTCPFHTSCTYWIPKYPSYRGIDFD